MRSSTTSSGGGDAGGARRNGARGDGTPAAVPSRASGAAAPDAGVRRAMILAAGLGTRLRPLTDHLPKPLVPLAGRPLLELIVRALAAAGVREIALNTHHLPGRIAAALPALAAACPACSFTLFHEPEILGTGGALANARRFLAAEEIFLLHNGDVLSDLDLRELVAAHRRHQPLATLALADWEPANTVLTAPDGVVRDIAGRLGTVPASRDRFLTYTGVAVLSRAFVASIPTGGPSSLVTALAATLRTHPGRVRGWAPQHLFWNDLGTPARYLDAHRRLLCGGVRLAVPLAPAEAGGGAGIHRAPEVELGRGAGLEGFVSLGRGARVGAGAQLEDCVVLAGAAVAAGARHRRAVIGDGWVIDGGAPAAGARLPREAARALLALAVVRDAGFSGDTQSMAITGHGSDRRFWRLREAGGRSAVLMRTEPGDVEFSRFVAIARFLHGQALGGPAILAVDRERCALVMEDLGEESLYQRMRGSGTGGAVPAGDASLCERALALLVDLQTRGTRAAAQCPEAGDRRFDLETLRWETDYFRRRFLAELAGLPAGELSALDGDFERLARAVHAQPTVLVHRDFQSQNIMVREGGRLGLVDFQGMRRGPLGYDPMSLIRDAYLELEPDRQEALLAAYRERLQAAGGPQLAPAAWRAMATAAGLQRTMQALGAFAYLSGVNGKLHFRRYIPCALRHLAAGLRELHEPGGGAAPGPLPRLEEVVARLM